MAMRQLAVAARVAARRTHGDVLLLPTGLSPITTAAAFAILGAPRLITRSPALGAGLRRWHHQPQNHQRRQVSTWKEVSEKSREEAQRSRDYAKSFKGQMFESIQHRLEREKAEQVATLLSRADRWPVIVWYQSLAVLIFGGIMWLCGWKVPRDPEYQQSTLPLDSWALRPPWYKQGYNNLQAAWWDFANIVGRDWVKDSDAERDTHSTSEWSSHQFVKDHKDELRPFCIVYPADTEQVSKIMAACHRRRIPVTAYSGGTSLEGNYEPTRIQNVCIDFSRMDKVLHVHPDDLDCVVQPGVSWEHLNDQLAEQGLLFPPDPGPGAKIGGMIGTGCSGTNAHRHGPMRDWVVSLTVVLADGTVIRTRQRPRKSSAGYDMTRLFVGSEGTLGVVTEATLRLAVRPAAESVAVASFASVRDAARCVSRIVARGVPLAAVELLDHDMMRFINAAGSTSRAWREAPTLFFKFAGLSERAVKEQADLAREVARGTGSESFEFARGADEAAELWSARKEALWSTMAMRKPGDHVWTTDVAVPISRLADIVEETKEDFTATGLTTSLVGHAGDGNFHMIILYNDEERKLAEDCVHRMVKRAVQMEGTVSGEHGVGLVKRDYLPHELGAATVDAMRKVKRTMDPRNILNPDKVLRLENPKPGEIAPW